MLYASALHQPSADITNQTYLTVFQNFGPDCQLLDLRPIFNYTVRSAQAMDCIGIGSAGYIALAYTTHSSHAEHNGSHSGSSNCPIVQVRDGSPVFELTLVNGTQTRIEIVQYFTELHLNRVYLMTLGPELYFVQSFAIDPQRDALTTSTNCLIYKWSGYHFDVLDELPCSSARQVQPFFVKSDFYMAIANYRAAANGDVDTFSSVYKYSVEHSKFMLYQRLHSHAAVDVQYFELAEAGRVERFLVIANSYNATVGGTGLNENGTTSATANVHSIIYKWTHDYFTPFQSILLYDVVQFLPILGPKGEI